MGLGFVLGNLLALLADKAGKDVGALLVGGGRDGGRRDGGRAGGGRDGGRDGGRADGGKDGQREEEMEVYPSPLAYAIGMASKRVRPRLRTISRTDVPSAKQTNFAQPFSWTQSATALSPSVNLAVAEPDNTNGTVQIPGVTFGPDGSVTGVDYSTDAGNGSVTVNGTTYFPNGTIVNGEGQAITPTTNADGSVSAGGFTVYPNGTVSSDGTNGGITFPGGLNISTGGASAGGIQTPGFTVNPDGTVTVKQAAPPAPKPAGSLVSPASTIMVFFTTLLATLLFCV
ncbi:unnamed protein product [Closterium sp. NIES-54]